LTKFIKNNNLKVVLTIGGIKMEKYQGCLVFDGDDTLWFNAYKYHLPMIRCAEIIYQDLGVYSPHPLKILQIHDEIDRKNVARYGFDKKRFPLSWVQTYQKICIDRGLRPKKSLEKKLYQTAAKFWQPPFPLMKGVYKTLRSLKGRGFYLVLLTIGDPEVQQKKIDSTGIKKYFHEIRIVLKDKSETLKEFSSKFGSEKVWMIGNSKKSDIAAAIQANVKAIYIPWATWDYEEWNCDPKIYKQSVSELKCISELLPFFGLNSKEVKNEKN
jgi:putative hydrolase of the HAD superfamily